MKSTLNSCFYCRAGWLALIGICGGSLTATAQSGCYRTPSEAASSTKESFLAAPVSSNQGYRIATVRFDTVLGRRWAMVVSCSHPEWPAQAFRIDRYNSSASLSETKDGSQNVAAVPVVRAGEVVRLWKQETLMRIEVAGVSEESGGLGKSIRVRVLHPNGDSQLAQEQLTGIVRGVSDVEIER